VSFSQGERPVVGKKSLECDRLTPLFRGPANDIGESAKKNATDQNGLKPPRSRVFIEY